MNLRCGIVVFLGGLVAWGGVESAGAEEPGRIPLRVLYLSRTKAPERTAAFTEFLSQNFASCRTERRAEYRPDMTRDIDVVLLDWSQDERGSERDPSPIGPLEEWQHPIVMLGSAGLLQCTKWRIIGDAG